MANGWLLYFTSTLVLGQVLLVQADDALLLKDEKPGLCPESFPWAVANGKTCCSEKPQLEDPTASYWSLAECPGTSMSCPEAKTCQNHHNPCIAYGSTGITWVHLTHFDLDKVNGDYAFYFDKGEYESNEPVFRNEKADYCIWWQPRHWWLGSCSKVGTKDGYAFIQPDLGCPLTFAKPLWIRASDPPGSPAIQGTDVSMSAVL